MNKHNKATKRGCIHAAISPNMALRIEAWLGIERGGEARVWLAQQSAYDLWQANLHKLTLTFHPYH